MSIHGNPELEEIGELGCYLKNGMERNGMKDVSVFNWFNSILEKNYPFRGNYRSLK